MVQEKLVFCALSETCFARCVCVLYNCRVEYYYLFIFFLYVIWYVCKYADNHIKSLFLECLFILFGFPDVQFPLNINVGHIGTVIGTCEPRHEVLLMIRPR